MMSANLSSVEEVFHAALERDEDERGAFLDARCGGDHALRHDIEELLALHGEAVSFIEKPIMDGAARLFEEHEQSDALIGEKIGPYKILRRISSGGMGAVYLAERADLGGRQVAIKLIKRGMDTEAVLGRFLNERQILAGFNHPNIARLHDGGATEDGLPYFVMEHVEGVPIDDYCDAHKLSLQERLELFLQVCAAISYAHRHTVIHRDLKPSNILVTSDSGGVSERGGVPKLLDFGIAKILQPGDSAEALATMTGFRLMTPEYASPEQVRGEPVTTASDVYSLGVVLYKLLTGASPYRLTTRSTQEIERAITEQEPTRPSTVRFQLANRNLKTCATLLRGDLDNILLMALRKEPGRRYQSVEQFAEDIRHYLENRPVLARRDNVAYRASKFVRRNRIATAAAALVFLSLIGGIIATSWQAKKARAQEAIAKAEKARAERRFNDVRQLAHSVLFDYHDAIKDLPGATRARERLVKDALQYLDSLAGEAGGDPSLQRELAAAYERVGDVRGQALSASLGDVAGALDSYRKALRIRESLAAANADAFQERRELAASYRKLGNRLLDTAAANRGLESLREALALYNSLAKQQPTNPDLRDDLAGIYNDIGVALEDQGDLASTLEHHRKALAIREQFFSAEPRNPRRRRDLSVTDVNLARAVCLSGDIKTALDINSKGLALRADLLAEDPANADYRRLLAIAYQNDADYRARLGDGPGALESFHKKLELDQQSVLADPANAQAQADLAYSCSRIADLLAEARKYSEALSFYRKALTAVEKVDAAAPQQRPKRYGVIITRACIAEMEAKLGQRSAALQECSNALTALKLTPDDPIAAFRTFRAEAYYAIGNACAAVASSHGLPGDEARNNWRLAREMYQSSLDIYLDLRSRGISTSEDASDKMTAEIARCDAALAERE